MIFPDLSTQQLDEKDRGMIKRMESFYAEAITINQAFWAEADTDSRFMAGDQTLWNDIYGNLPANRRRMFSFNRIARVINMIDGHQRNNRKSTIVTGVENADDDTADQFTKILMWINSQEGVLETISDSFRGSLVTGLNLLQVWMDYRSDPVSGNIKVDTCAYNTFLIDPFFRKKDLSDCNSIWKRSFLTKREVIALLPNYESKIISLQGNDNRDGKFQFMPESYSFSMKNLLTYDEYYYKDYRSQKLLVDSQTGETQEWRGQDEERLKLFLKQYPQITMIESEVPTVKLAIVVQGHVLYDGPQPSGIDRYPFVPVIAYHYPQLPYFEYRIQGVVRALRDSQYLYNRRQVIQLDILESQITSGWIFKEGSLINPKDVWTLQGQGKGIGLKDTAQMTDVQQIVAPSIPPSMIDITKMLGDELSQISGINEELLGSANDDKAGILAQLRQGAGLTTLQILFDNLDYAQRELGHIMIDMIQANFTPGKVQKILEDEQPTDQFYNKAFGKYGASVVEGLNTANQRNLQFAQLIQLREIGVPIPDDMLLESSTMQNKKQLIESIEKAKETQQQQASQQAELAMAEIQSKIKLNEARAVSDQGLGLERISRVEENQALAVERRAQAVRDEDAGLLDKIKALKEIESMDMAHLAQLVQLAQLLRTNPEETAGGQAEEDKTQNELSGVLESQPASQPQPIGESGVQNNPMQLQA
jgi:hypothetical protein